MTLLLVSFILPSGRGAISSQYNRRTTLGDLVHHRDFYSVCLHVCISRKGSEQWGCGISAWETCMQLPALPEAPCMMYGCSVLQLWNVRAFSACLTWAYREGGYGKDCKTLRAKVMWIIPVLKIESPANCSLRLFCSVILERRVHAASVPRQRLMRPWLQSPCRYSAWGCLWVLNPLGEPLGSHLLVYLA